MLIFLLRSLGTIRMALVEQFLVTNCKFSLKVAVFSESCTFFGKW